MLYDKYDKLPSSHWILKFVDDEANDNLPRPAWVDQKSMEYNIGNELISTENPNDAQLITKCSKQDLLILFRRSLIVQIGRKMQRNRLPLAKYITHTSWTFYRVILLVKIWKHGYYILIYVSTYICRCGYIRMYIFLHTLHLKYSKNCPREPEKHRRTIY